MTIPPRRLVLFIGIIVSAMQERHQHEEEHRRGESEARAHAEREEMLALMRRLDERVARLERNLARRGSE